VDAVSTIRRRLRNCSLLIPPTVLDELGHLTRHAEHPAEREYARRFLRQHRAWGFQLIYQVPLGAAFVERIVERLRSARLLPPAETNDALILAESAALGCSVLLTGDEHLRGIDYERLSFELSPLDVAAPIMATPREVVRKFFH
jgi:predicted nucleic acid-binding protein